MAGLHESQWSHTLPVRNACAHHVCAVDDILFEALPGNISDAVVHPFKVALLSSLPLYCSTECRVPLPWG